MNPFVTIRDVDGQSLINCSQIRDCHLFDGASEDGEFQIFIRWIGCDSDDSELALNFKEADTQRFAFREIIQRISEIHSKV